ncbi:hypothetical protein SLA2020_431810 [Shorea laevis]
MGQQSVGGGPQKEGAVKRPATRPRPLENYPPGKERIRRKPPNTQRPRTTTEGRRKLSRKTGPEEMTRAKANRANATLPGLVGRARRVTGLRLAGVGAQSRPENV